LADENGKLSTECQPIFRNRGKSFLRNVCPWGLPRLSTPMTPDVIVLHMIHTMSHSLINVRDAVSCERLTPLQQYSDKHSSTIPSSRIILDLS